MNNPPDSSATETFPALFLNNVRNLSSKKVAYREKDYGIWQSYTWVDVYEQTRDFALGLAAMGFGPGDRLCVVGDNRPELYWGMLAAQSLGGVPVPLYQDSIEREMEFIVDHADARFALVEDQEQVDKMLGIKEACPKLEHVIYKDTRGMRNYQDDHLKSFQSVQEEGRKFGAEHPGFFEEQIARVQPEDMSVICYTSGTTGRPKGVILSHKNLIFASRKIIEHEGMEDDVSIMAYLPMAWVGDFFYSFSMTIVGGYTVNCPESADTVLLDLREIGPNYFFAPPRIWENILTSVMIRMEDAGWVKRKLFEAAIALANRMQRKRMDGKPVGIRDRLLFALGQIFVYGPLLDNLGMGRVRIAYSAGEAIGPEIFDFFRALGINLKQFYGMTEAGIFVTMPSLDDIKSDTTGRPVPWMDVQFSKEGEVLLRGESIFKGYLKNDEATAEAFAEGYFKTGDAGIIDQDGHLRIIDRAKDVSHLQDGTMFAPKFIENKLKFSPYVKEAVAIGQEKPFVTIMVNIDPQSVGNWAERKNLAYSSYMDLSQKPEVIDLITREIVRVNDSLSGEAQLKGTQIRRFLILHKELDPDDEEITRTRKVRRGFIAEKYNDLISALYSDANHVQTEARVTFEDGRQATIKADISIREVAGVA